VNAKKIDELCEFISGLWTGKKTPYINVGVIRNTNFKKNGNLDLTEIALLDVEEKQFKSRQLQYGDLVLEKSGGGPKQPVGRVCVFEKNEGLYSLSNFTSAIRVKNKSELDYKYLHYYLRHLYISGETEKIQTNSTGIRNLQLSLYKEFLVPLPSLATQQKIVAKLDAIFAESLWQSTLDNINTEFSGEFQELGSCVELLSGYAFKSSDYTNNLDDIPLLRGDNLGPNNIDFSEAKRFPKERFNEQIKFLLNENDIVLGMDRPLISSGLRICKISAKDTPSLLVQRVMRMRCNPSIDSDFIFLMLNSRRFISHLLGEQTGLGVPHISGKTISSFSMKIPNIATQKKIVIKLSNILRNVRRYVNSKNTLLDQLENLRNSTLKQAFNGELVKDGK
jgi:type I restriction enzyme S subunit